MQTQVFKGPLSGVTIVDISSSYAGPTASMYLADLGAHVIKVERPEGDDSRGWGPPFIGDTSAWYVSANRNKTSITADLSEPAGQDQIMSLLRKADVLIHNLTMGRLRRFGLDYDSLKNELPHLVHCTISGFGATGPAADEPGYDLAAQARSGLMSVTGELGRQPQRVSTALSDITTGMCAAMAISAALVRQRQDGQGDEIDVSLLDTDLALMAPRIASYLAGEAEPAPSGGTDSVLAVYQAFATADRTIVVAIGNDAMWRRFCSALALDHLAKDERFASNLGRRNNRSEIITEVSSRLLAEPAAHWIEILGEYSVPVSLVQGLSEVVTDPQVVARGSIMPDPRRPGLFSVHPPFRLRSLPQPRNESAPELGEHNP